MPLIDHARGVLDDCERGDQRCDECPLVECCDNQSSERRELEWLREQWYRAKLRILALHAALDKEEECLQAPRLINNTATVREDSVALDSYNEAQYRRRIAEQVTAALDRKGLSHEELATTMGASKAQVQRLLNEQRGGSLTLLSLVQAGRALGLSLEDMLKEK